MPLIKVFQRIHLYPLFFLWFSLNVQIKLLISQSTTRVKIYRRVFHILTSLSEHTTPKTVRSIHTVFPSLFNPSWGQALTLDISS